MGGVGGWTEPACLPGLPAPLAAAPPPGLPLGSAPDRLCANPLTAPTPSINITKRCKSVWIC
jgi:hypothetical protein